MIMVDSWKLVTIGMWVDKLEKEGALTLICDTFDWDELWEAAAELNKQCAGRTMEAHIPRNRDLGEQKDRVRIVGANVLNSLHELKSQAEPPVFVVTSTSLALVPGVVKSTLKADPAVESRLDNMEKLLENLSKGLQEMKNSQKTEQPAIQVNGVPVQQQAGLGRQDHVQGVKQNVMEVDPRTGARNKHSTLPIGGLDLRSRSDSRKRKAEQDQREQQAAEVQDQPPQDERQGWNDVAAGRGRRKKVQYGTSKLRVAPVKMSTLQPVI